MKRIIQLAPLAIMLACSLSFYTLRLNSSRPKTAESVPPVAPPFVEKDIQSGKKGPELEKWYFEQWHQPYGAVLEPEMLQRIWSDVQQIPSENDLGVAVVNSWQAMGPFGMQTPGGARYSGRILDIDLKNGTKVAAASGGLWGFFLIFPVALSDQLSSLAIATIESDPTDQYKMFVGTGEPYIRGGTGMWKTTDGGTTWTQVSLSPVPAGFFRIRMTPGNPTKIHAVTTAGYYRSDNGGSTWTRRLTGITTDIAFNSANTNIMYTAIWGDGVYKSTDGGDTWSKLTAGGIPTTNVGRTAIAVSESNPNTIFVSIARNDNNEMLGVYRTTNGGTSWSNLSPPENFLGGQGWYDNVIAICPTNENIVLVGGVTMFRTTNRGLSWTRIDDENLHVDHHAITWHSAGTQVWVGNDGGMSYSNDQGATWTTSANFFPITQYVNFDVGQNNNAVIFGGSQDNGYSGTTNGGSIWRHTLGGDGGGISIDPNDASRVFGTLGVYGGNWAFQRHRSTDFGQSWVGINNGIDPSGQWFHKIRNDKVPPIYLFNNSGPYVYQSTNSGDTWTKLNTTAFPGSEIYNMTVSRYATGGAVVYACLNTTSPAGQQLRVYDNGTWYERSTGFPTSVNVRGVAPHPINANKAYALMQGFVAGQKVFKTTNRGVTWTNITGNLPNVAVGDLVAHPTDDNKLYLGTESGCFRTTNGGTSWHRWNNGMPEATIVTEMAYIDSIAINGRFYVLAATYGRGIWQREVSGDDPTDVEQRRALPDKFELAQNYPNPFNPATTIKFTLPSADRVELAVFDVQGRRVASLLDQQLEAGEHSVHFDGAHLASGVYFYRIQTGKFTATKKMTLVK